MLEVLFGGLLGSEKVTILHENLARKRCYFELKCYYKAFGNTAEGLGPSRAKYETVNFNSTPMKIPINSQMYPE